MAECQKQTEVVLYACDAFCSLTNHELLWFLDIKGPSTGGGLKPYMQCRQLGGLCMAECQKYTEVVLNACDAFCSLTN